MTDQPDKVDERFDNAVAVIDRSEAGMACLSRCRLRTELAFVDERSGTSLEYFSQETDDYARDLGHLRLARTYWFPWSDHAYHPDPRNAFLEILLQTPSASFKFNEDRENKYSSVDVVRSTDAPGFGFLSVPEAAVGPLLGYFPGMTKSWCSDLRGSRGPRTVAESVVRGVDCVQIDALTSHGTYHLDIAPAYDWSLYRADVISRTGDRYYASVVGAELDPRTAAIVTKSGFSASPLSRYVTHLDVPRLNGVVHEQQAIYLQAAMQMYLRCAAVRRNGAGGRGTVSRERSVLRG